MKELTQTIEKINHSHKIILEINNNIYVLNKYLEQPDSANVWLFRTREEVKGEITKWEKKRAVLMAEMKKSGEQFIELCKSINF